MSNSEKLERVIESFTEPELRDLLSFSCRRDIGDIYDLRARASQLLTLDSEPVVNKIRELENRRWYSRRKYEPRNSIRKYQPRNPIPKYQLPAGYAGQLRAEDNFVIAEHEPLPTYAPRKCGTGSSEDKKFLVNFKSSPFYGVVSVPLKPTALIPCGSSVYQENHFQFYLAPHLLPGSGLLAPWHRHSDSFNDPVKVVLRFCTLNNSKETEQDDKYPPKVGVTVNGLRCHLPDQVLPGVDPIRPSRPVDITGHCRFSDSSPNKLVVSWSPGHSPATFVLAVFAVRRRGASSLAKTLRRRNQIYRRDHVEVLIMEKLERAAGLSPRPWILDLCPGVDARVKVSLICPLSGTKMKVPCRTLDCRHLQCFDGVAFVRANEADPKWQCPVCEKRAPFDRLFLDELFADILGRVPPHCKRVQFYSNGKWEPVVQEQNVDETPYRPGRNTFSAHLARSSTSSRPRKPLQRVIDRPSVIDLSEADDSSYVVASSEVRPVAGRNPFEPQVPDEMFDATSAFRGSGDPMGSCSKSRISKLSPVQRSRSRNSANKFKPEMIDLTSVSDADGSGTNSVRKMPDAELPGTLTTSSRVKSEPNQQQLVPEVVEVTCVSNGERTTRTDNPSFVRVHRKPPYENKVIGQTLADSNFEAEDSPLPNTDSSILRTNNRLASSSGDPQRPMNGTLPDVKANGISTVVGTALTGAPSAAGIRDGGERQLSGDSDAEAPSTVYTNPRESSLTEKKNARTTDVTVEVIDLTSDCSAADFFPADVREVPRSGDPDGKSGGIASSKAEPFDGKSDVAVKTKVNVEVIDLETDCNTVDVSPPVGVRYACGRPRSGDPDLEIFERQIARPVPDASPSPADVKSEPHNQSSKPDDALRDAFETAGDEVVFLYRFKKMRYL